MKNSFKQLLQQSIFAMLAVSAVASVQAAEIVVTPGSTLWTSPAGETRSGATAGITGTFARSGNGSLEMAGERTRTVMGSLYTTPVSLGLFDQLSSLTFDWAIASGSVATLHPDYTPALRVTVIDGGVRSELIWEGVYNGTYGNTTRDTWYTSKTNDVFHRFSGGTTFENGSQLNLTLQGWQNSAYYSDTAYIAGFSVGVGGSAGLGYRGFADNVAITLGGVTNTYNFELAAAAVPEPGSLALLGLGMLGAAVARRKQRAK